MVASVKSSDLEPVAYAAAAKLYAERVIGWSPEELDTNVRRLTTWYVEERIMKGIDLGPFTETAANSWLRLLEVSMQLWLGHGDDQQMHTETLFKNAASS